MEWTTTAPAVHPFDASVGSDRPHVVHVAICRAGVADAGAAVIEAGRRALGLLADGVDGDAAYLLFSWDEVNSSLSVVAAPGDLGGYSTHVVKVVFEGMQAALEACAADGDASVDVALAHADAVRAGAGAFALQTRPDERRGLRVAYLCESDGIDELEVFGD